MSMASLGRNHPFSIAVPTSRHVGVDRVQMNSNGTMKDNTDLLLVRLRRSNVGHKLRDTLARAVTAWTDGLMAMLAGVLACLAI